MSHGSGTPGSHRDPPFKPPPEGRKSDGTTALRERAPRLIQPVGDGAEVDAPADAPADVSAEAPGGFGRIVAVQPLRLMTYNVRYFGHATRGIASTSAAITKIARSLTELEPTPDLICLQEVETRSLRSTTMNRQRHPEETQLDRLMTELDAALEAAGKPERYTAYYFPAHAYRLTAQTNIYTTGLAVIARDTFTIAHHNAGRPHDITHRRLVKNLKQTRICAHVTFKHESGVSFDVFNTHLSLPNVFTKEFWTGKQRMGFGPNQLKEAKTLADFVDRERRSESFVIMGDFNALPGSPVDRYLREERGFIDAFSKVQKLSESESRSWPTAGFMNLRMHLDHVYSCAGLEWVDFDGTQPFGKKGPFAGLSDHVPLIARFRLPPGSATHPR